MPSPVYQGQGMDRGHADAIHEYLPVGTGQDRRGHAGKDERTTPERDQGRPRMGRARHQHGIPPDRDRRSRRTAPVMHDLGRPRLHRDAPRHGREGCDEVVGIKGEGYFLD